MRNFLDDLTSRFHGDSPAKPAPRQIADADAHSMYQFDKHTVAIITLSVDARVGLADQDEDRSSDEPASFSDLSKETLDSFIGSLEASVEVPSLPDGVTQQASVHEFNVSSFEDPESQSAAIHAEVLVRVFAAEDEDLDSLSRASSISQQLGFSGALEEQALLQSGLEPLTPEQESRLAVLSSLPETASEELKTALVSRIDSLDIFPFRLSEAEVDSKLVYSFAGPGDSDQVVRFDASLGGGDQMIGDFVQRRSVTFTPVINHKELGVKYTRGLGLPYIGMKETVSGGEIDDYGIDWVDGPLLEAAREGKPLVIENINDMSPAEIAQLFPFIDRYSSGDIVEIAHMGGTIEIAPGFMILVSVDEDTESFNPVNGATASRMA